TFYDRYTGATPTADRRQPLPSLFAARYIQGGPGGFATNYKIWREGVTNNSLACSSSQYAVNSVLLVTSVVRFDEHENSFGVTLGQCVSPCNPQLHVRCCRRQSSVGRLRRSMARQWLLCGSGRGRADCSGQRALWSARLPDQHTG